MSLIKSDYLGSGKGLSGFDSAAQAGMILSEVCELPDDQHNVVVARYGKTTYKCKCCKQDAPTEEWIAAIDSLSHCIELEGVHRAVRIMMVEKAICGGKLDISKLCKDYSLGRSALYAQFAIIKTKFRKLERVAMANLDNVFLEKQLLVA